MHHLPGKAESQLLVPVDLAVLALQSVSLYDSEVFPTDNRFRNTGISEALCSLTEGISSFPAETTTYSDIFTYYYLRGGIVENPGSCKMAELACV